MGRWAFTNSSDLFLGEQNFARRGLTLPHRYPEQCPGRHRKGAGRKIRFFRQNFVLTQSVQPGGRSYSQLFGLLAVLKPTQRATHSYPVGGLDTKTK